MNFAIIAAGEGSRLVQEGVPTPKPLVDLDGRPMIRRLIDIFVQCGARRISVIVNNEMTAVREYLESLSLPVPLHIVVKSTPSSMHSFYEVSRIFPEGERFILTTVDTIFDAGEFARYASKWENAPADIDGMMAVTDYIDDEKPLYVDVDPRDMRITAFVDKAYDGARYISGGIYGLDSRAVAVLEQCFADGVSRMRNYQRALLQAGLRLQAVPMGKIIDVDHASDIETARNMIANSK